MTVAILALVSVPTFAGWVGRSVTNIADSIWIESEKPSYSNVKIDVGAPGHPELLSAGAWLTITHDLPPEGALLTYSFASDAGNREIWHRVGFEFARSPFEWRIDNGSWKRVEPNALTIDLEELADWNGVAWMDMGGIDLAAGDHKLEIHIPKPEKGGVLYGSDSFAIVRGVFQPYSKWQPGQDPLSDRDRAAETHRFAITDQASLDIQNPNQTIKLIGDWQVARDDEVAPALVATPMAPLNQAPVWTAIQVPGDKAEMRPDLSLAHRVWYRTRIEVPEHQLNRSFVLTFHQNSLNTTVIVNGQLCGFNKNPFVRWDCDVTKAIHAGLNEVKVGIRDAWYGFEQDPKNPSSLRENFAFPASRSHQGFLHLAYPVWGCFKSGLLDTPELTVAGRAYVSDVFIRPRVSKGQLDTNLTIKSNVASDQQLSVLFGLIDLDSGQVVAKWKGIDTVLRAGEDRVLELSKDWANPTLWWPDHPKMYVLRTVIEADHKAIDVSDTQFGFREWTVDGPRYLLNGVVWHGWAELVQGNDPVTWLKNYRTTRQRFQRMAGAGQSGDIHWLGMPFDAALDWCDKNGVTIRRCGPLDGEAIGYMAIDNQGGINKPLLENVRDQIVAQVKGERNHPSVNIWSVENEWLYINTLNLYGGLMDEFEADMAKTVAAVRAVDPSRLAMTDGGGAGKSNILPVQGDHYVYTNDPNDYPNLAYGLQPNGAGRGRWVYDGTRPRYAGEDYFATGINPADYAWIQGEEAFGGKASAHRGMALVQRMITEGYRWSGVFTGFHLWIGDEGSEFHDKYVANAERAVFVKQYDSAFTGGTSVVRTLGVFNESHSNTPLTLRWKLVIGKTSLQTGSKALSVAPGGNVKLDVRLAIPRVLMRTSGAFELDLVAEGKVVFHDSKGIAILPEPPIVKVPLAVYDPGETVTKYLSAHHIEFHRLTSLSALPPSIPNLLIGPDALTESESSSPNLAAFAFDGHRVIVLEQRFPLKYSALPNEMTPAEGGGSFGFTEDSSHVTVSGLTNEDLRGWGVNGRLYERPYAKSAKGMRSLVQVGPRLGQTALAEVPVGKGVVLICQLQVGHNLSRGGPARNVLSNLLAYAANYRRVELPVRSVSSDRNLIHALDAIGVRHSAGPDPVAAIQGPGIAIISANPTNLHLLAQNLSKVRTFTQKGGFLVLNGLTPEGLSDYNRIVGVDHMIRPFRREKTSLQTPRDPLATGITTGDVVMYSGEKMFDFNDDRFVASDIFNFIVDTDDVAPFASLPNDYFYNTVNGFVSSDGWKYIFSFELKNGQPDYTMTFPKALPFKELTWIGNGFYHKVKRIGLSFDGGPVSQFDVLPNTDPQILSISPARSAKSIKLSILDWTRDPGVGNVVGIDNVYLRVGRSADWNQKVKPLLNVGGLVRYPQGKGAVVLANLAFRDKEDVPENAGKKQAILTAILRNLGGTFSGGANMIIPGARGVEYSSVSLAGKATAYRSERGWFGDSKKTLAALPTGHQVFANVPFEVYDFATSPVPTAIVLGGPSVPGNLPERVDGIRVGAKASALFFLQTARIDSPRDDREKREGKRYEMARYLVRYVDGTIVKVPIFAEIDVDDFRQKSPKDLSGARLAWTKRFSEGEDSASAYLMQWTNPRPDVAIATVSLEYGADRKGVPALLALTLAR